MGNSYLDKKGAKLAAHYTTMLIFEQKVLAKFVHYTLNYKEHPVNSVTEQCPKKNSLFVITHICVTFCRLMTIGDKHCLA